MHTSEGKRIVFYTPTFEPVGGVVKIFDYIEHARSLGFQVEIACNKKLTQNNPIWDMEHFAEILRTCPIHETLDVAISGDDFAFFSWPSHYKNISKNISKEVQHHQIIHIVQNVRHANPKWEAGYPTRLLSRPMSRIMITDEVDGACRPWLNEQSLTRTIIEGHRWNYFSKARSGDLPAKINVGYTTWKSQVGVELEKKMVGNTEFNFKSIRKPAGWPELRELYHWSDVFLGCPGKEEGFYLVGLEAMAAGCILIMPDAGGNRSYAAWGENCVEVEFEDLEDYEDALTSLAKGSPGDAELMRALAYKTLEAHTLEAEKTGFAKFMESLEEPG